MFAIGRFTLVLLVLTAWGCKREIVPTAIPPATSPTSPADIRRWIADLSDQDGAQRLAATQALFQLGAAALEPLRQAGAQQISPSGTISTRRLDMIYSLLAGLEPTPRGAHAGYATGGFGLHLEPACTLEEVQKLGANYGFTVSGPFQPDARPQCYVELQRGKNLEDVLEALLCHEPRVVTLNLNYFER